METAAAPHPSVGLPPRDSRLVCGWSAFDEWDLVRPGRVLLLDVGAAPGQRLLCRLVADAVAKRGEAIVLDGGNWTEAYRLGDEAEAMGHSRLGTLMGVRVARGFTAYQLQSLVEDALPLALGECTGLVVAASLPEMYLDEDLKADEARVLVERALRVLRDVATQREVPVVVSNSTLAPGAQHRLRGVLEAGVDEVAQLLPAPQGGLRVRVPSLGVSVLAPAPGARQRRLDDYAPRLPATRGGEGAFVRAAPDARIRYLPKRAGEMRLLAKGREAALS